MGVFDKLKDMMGVPEDDYDDMENEQYIDEQGYYDGEEDIPTPSFMPNNTAPQPKSRGAQPAAGTGNKLVNMAASMQLHVVLVKPERFEDASSIADHLNAKSTVVLNLESTNKETSRRLVDFLSGVAYANNGQIKRIAANTFIITPYNVDITGDLLDELESTGAFF